MNTSKQIHLHYSEKNSMHYAVFWLFKGHIFALHSKDNRHIRSCSPGFRCIPSLKGFGETRSRWLVIVVLVLDVVYG